MKTIKSLLMFSILLSTTFLMAGNVKVKFNVNMHCEDCKKKIEKNIAFEKGVKALELNLESKTAVITYDDTKTTVEKLQTGFQKIGYVATVVNNATESKPCSSNQQCEKKCSNQNEQGEKKCCSETEGDKKCCSEAEGEKKACNTENSSCQKNCQSDKSGSEVKKCCSGTETK